MAAVAQDPEVLEHVEVQTLTLCLVACRQKAELIRYVTDPELADLVRNALEAENQAGDPGECQAHRPAAPH